MHLHSLDTWKHSHDFLSRRHAQKERRVWIVVAVTAATMVAEIAGGTLWGSMAVVADGWHMATHAAALAVAALSYAYARRHRDDATFSFGTYKVGELAGFASAVALGLVALSIAYACLQRLAAPVDIAFHEALAVATLGLVINLVCALLLLDHDHHDENHHSHHDHQEHADLHTHDAHAHHEDSNYRAAIAHVLADALTSVLAIAALLAAFVWCWTWVDPLVGLLGAALVASWSYSLMRSSAAVLLDAVPDQELEREIRSILEVGDVRVTDLHLWRVGPGCNAAIIAIVTHDPSEPDDYKQRLRQLAALSHVTVEVNRCGEGRDGCKSADDFGKRTSPNASAFL